VVAAGTGAGEVEAVGGAVGLVGGAVGSLPTAGVDGLALFICLSISAFSSSVIIVVATEVISFMMEISPIYER
jgi:hypothetical protein